MTNHYNFNPYHLLHSSLSFNFKMTYSVIDEDIIIADNIYTIKLSNDNDSALTTCIIESRLPSLSIDDIKTISIFMAKQINQSGGTHRAVMQIDTHCTRQGSDSPWIGMSLYLSDIHRIPIQIISADIGCGLSVYPIIRTMKCKTEPDAGQEEIYVNIHLRSNDLTPSELKHLQNRFMLSCRINLLRGRFVEDGKAKPNIAKFFTQASQYLAETPGMMPLADYADQMHKLLTELKFNVPKVEPILDMSVKQSSALAYCFGFLCSLGSSGNHFAELAVDTISNQLYAVIHSGSRGLGAKIFDAINERCMSKNGCGLADGELAELYTQAYDLLEQTALMNRYMCFSAIHSGLQLQLQLSSHPTPPEITAIDVRTILYYSQLMSMADPSIRNRLMAGMVHNGLSAFADDVEKNLVFIVKKGSIAMSLGAGIGFVALSAGIGCVAFICNDADNNYREISIAEARKRIDSGYTISNSTCVATFGHGAGRDRSTTQSSKGISHQMVIDHSFRSGYVCNCGPGVYGDGPGAYRDVSLDYFDGTNRSVIQLSTLTSYKECITFNKDSIEKFADACIDTYNECNELNDEQSKQKILALDLILLLNHLKKDYRFSNYSLLCKRQCQIIADEYGNEYIHQALLLV